jgi:hypothetical protein
MDAVDVQEKQQQLEAQLDQERTAFQQQLEEKSMECHREIALARSRSVPIDLSH